MQNTGNTKNGDQPSQVELVQQLIRYKVDYLETEQDFLYQSFDQTYRLPIVNTNFSTSDQQLKRLKDKYDELIERIEQLTHSRNQLLVIQAFLTDENADAVYELLTNDKYMFYTPSSLSRLLGLESYLNDLSVALSDN